MCMYVYYLVYILIDDKWYSIRIIFYVKQIFKKNKNIMYNVKTQVCVIKATLYCKCINTTGIKSRVSHLSHQSIRKTNE